MEYSLKKHWFYLVFLLFWACKVNTGDEKGTAPKMDFPYKTSQPNEVFQLPKQLKEISGVAVYRERTLVCIQDEKANIYFYNLDSKSIEKKVDFGKNGDYEGLALVGNTAYVLRNNGNLYEVKNFDSDTSKTVKHKSFLSADFNTEGLCYDEKNNRLLVACKAGGKGDHKHSQRSIFAFDLNEKTYLKNPAYTIGEEGIRNFLKKQQRQDEVMRLDIYKEKEGLDMAFNPSGISIHPKTGNLYILSAFTPLLAVIDADNGSILHFTFLSPTLYPQPEGITFDKDGNLILSSEGRPGIVYLVAAQ